MLEIIFLSVSILINIIFVLYARWLIKIIKIKEEDVNNLSQIIGQYVSHVKSVHDMEMFYGDQTLSSLISHGTAMIEKIENFDYIVLEEEESTGDGDGEEEV